MTEDGNGQVGYMPVVYLMSIIDETQHEEESDTTFLMWSNLVFRLAHLNTKRDGTTIGGEMG